MRKDFHLKAIQQLISVLLVFLVFMRIAAAQQAAVDTRPPIRVHGNAQKAIVGAVPDQIRRAYGFDQVSNQGAGQVIGIVDAYNHPRIENDLAVFSDAFGLPACTANNGCFQKIYATDKHPGTDTLWALEISLDVEWAHAIAPQARILLVEAPSAKLADMVQAVDVAVQNGATVISMSWGTYEFANEASYDNHFVAANVAFVAASGDFGNPGFYPAASPFVTGVGGTTLSVDAAGNYLGETAWSGSGGGLSTVEIEPAYQAQFNASGRRGIPDVSYNADPSTGFAVYTSVPYQGFGGWIQVAGTSAGAPQWSALLAIANSMRMAANKAPLTSNDSFYAAAAGFHDITSGTNGTCGAICAAGPGYDFVTGLGTPQVPSLINLFLSMP
jgi:subtilase family serine protease